MCSSTCTLQFCLHVRYTTVTNMQSRLAVQRLREVEILLMCHLLFNAGYD